MLQLKDISYEVDGKRILDHVSIDLNDHFVVITGPNGSGKSTLAKVIAGILTPTEGQILLDGEDHRAGKKRDQLCVSAAGTL